MTHLKMHSLNKIDENVSKIARLFPNCVTEAKDENGEITHKIDFDMLKQELSNTLVDGREERYQFTWPDKKKSVLLANAPISKTLRPCREESVDFDNTENLYIEGDNLEVLKLLQETYLGKIKMIYIDPPYNTGNDFVYNDEFSVSSSEFSEKSGNFDEEGKQLVDNYTRNTESNGRFHTDWLNMMYPRLKLARDLLTDDGVIFISIDDNEQSNLKKICDEVFGNKNFVAQINWKGRGGRQDSRYFAVLHEYIFCYAKNIASFVAGEEIKSGDVYPKFDDEKKRYYKTQLLRKWGANCRKEDRPNLFYPIKDPDGNDFYPIVEQLDASAHQIKFDGCWRWAPATMTQAIKDGRVEFQKNKQGNWIAYEKIFAPIEGEEKTKKYVTWIDDIGTGTTLIKDLFGTTPFDYAKSPDLINHFLKMGNVEDNSIILDFFSGSASTAHAVMQLNAEDGGHRKFIMVQLPEATDEKSEAYKAGYKNICEIGKERIRRAGQQILKQVQNDKAKISRGLDFANTKSENNLFSNTETSLDVSNPCDNKKLDVGFRVLKCDTSNMEDVYYTPEHIDKSTLFKDNIKSDRTGEDLLFQTMLDLGIMLSSKIETRKINGKEVFCVEGNYLMACFDKDVTEDVIAEIAKMKPYYFVMRDPADAQDGDSLITNFEQIFTTYSPETVRKVL